MHVSFALTLRVPPAGTNTVEKEPIKNRFMPSYVPMSAIWQAFCSGLQLVYPRQFPLSMPLGVAVSPAEFQLAEPVADTLTVALAANVLTVVQPLVVVFTLTEPLGPTHGSGVGVGQAGGRDGYAGYDTSWQAILT